MIKQLETEAITTSTTTTNNMEHDYNTSPSNSGEDRLKLGLSMVDEYIKALLKTCSRFCKGDISDGPGDHREALVQKQQRIEVRCYYKQGMMRGGVGRLLTNHQQK